MSFITYLKRGAICASLLLCIGTMTSCSSKGDGAYAAEESAEDIEAAHIAGREAARVFITTPWDGDSTALQQKLLEAKAGRAHWDTLQMKKCIEAYDSAFISTIRTVNPDVADAIK